MDAATEFHRHACHDWAINWLFGSGASADVVFAVSDIFVVIGAGGVHFHIFVDRCTTGNDSVGEPRTSSSGQHSLLLMVCLHLPGSSWFSAAHLPVYAHTHGVGDHFGLLATCRRNGIDITRRLLAEFGGTD